MTALKEILSKIGNIANTADQGSFLSKAWNIVISIIAAAALIVTFACKAGIAVPGVACDALTAAEAPAPVEQ